MSGTACRTFSCALVALTRTMSQQAHQTDGARDAEHDASASDSDSPTIGRQQHYYPSAKLAAQDTSNRYACWPSIACYSGCSNTYTLRDCRSQRRAAPSPLQTSTTATSPPGSATPTRTTFPRPSPNNNSKSQAGQSTHHPSPESDSPRSPKERLDDLLASESSFYRSDDSSDSSRTATTPR